jgi:hypothetical protein
MNPTSELVEQIRAGSAPRNIKEFAAQGLLPLSDEELISLQVLLSTDKDVQISRLCQQSLANVPGATWERIAEKKNPDLDVLSYCLEQAAFPFSLKEKILLNTSLPDDAFVQVAEHQTGQILELVLNNQVRLLRDPRIFEALERNTTLTLDQKRRLEEFRTEFIVKPREQAKLTEAPVEVVLKATVEDILAQVALDAEGRNILLECENWPADALSEDQAHQSLHNILGEELRKTDPDVVSAYIKILKMTQPEKIRLALLGGKEERSILIRDGNRQVASMVLKSPKLTDTEAENFSQMRGLDSDLLRKMGQSREFIKRYSVIHNLVKNPKTPSPISLNLLKLLRAADLKNLEKDKNIPEVIRRQAKKIRDMKEPQKKKN